MAELAVLPGGRDAYLIRAGRDLSFSPRWDGEDAGIVFDSRSGDHWVVSLPAMTLLRRVSAAGCIAREEVMTYGTDRELPDPVAVLDEFVRAGILTKAVR